MPVKKIGPNKWRWGQTGKVYPTRQQAAAQGAAIRAAQQKRGKK